MKAVRINQWAQPYVLEDIDQPVPNDDEVLVQVRAASVNPIDGIVAAGYLQFMVSAPMTAGTDFAGEVAAVGANVTHVKPGDSVYGMISIRGGSFAEYVVVKAQEVAVKPQSLDYTQAGAVPLAALAAWHSLIGFAEVQSGERVLILGAGGAVGSFALQLAKAKGAYVIASDIPEKAAFLKELGADEIINSSEQKFEEVAGEVDIVLNFADESFLERAYSILKKGGRYATGFPQPSQEDAEKRGLRTFGLATYPTIEHLTSLAQMIDEGKVKVFVNRTFPLQDAQAAIAYRQASSEPGKVVLTV